MPRKTKKDMKTEMKYRTTISNFRNRIMKIRFNLSKEERANHSRLIAKMRKLLWLNAEVDNDFLAKSKRYREMSNYELIHSDVLFYNWL